MARAFRHLAFDFETFKTDLFDFRALLDGQTNLSEKDDILPFFKQRPQLGLQIATFIAALQSPDQYAFEFNLFGDFFADLVITKRGARDICLIEFEDATPTSLFRRSRKGKPPFGARFEQGFSQVMDWFCKLDDMQRTYDCRDLFGHMEVEYHGVLVVGRSQFLNDALRRRLEWRSLRTAVNSKRIYVLTYDDVYNLLWDKFETIQLYRS
jgi:Domain of unknown function (DUF4263)